MVFSVSEFPANVYVFITHGLMQASNALLTYGLPPGSTFSVLFQYYVHQSFLYLNPIFSHIW